MKAILDGMKNAKLRTALSAVIAFIAAAAICAALFNVNTAGTKGAAGGRALPESSETADGSSDSETTSAAAAVISLANADDSQSADSADGSDSADSAAANDSDSNGDSDSTVQDGEMQRGDFSGGQRGNVSTSVTAAIIAAATVAAAIILLAVINYVSTKKKKTMFLAMLAGGVSAKAIKRQLFAEAFAVVFLFGVFGTALGAAVSSPLSAAIGQSRTADITIKDSEDTTGDASASDSSGRGFGRDFDGEMPEDFDESQMPADMGGAADGVPDMGGSETDSMLQPGGDFGENADGGAAGSSVWQYIIACAGALVFTTVAATAAGAGCSAPVKAFAKTKTDESEGAAV